MCGHLGDRRCRQDGGSRDGKDCGSGDGEVGPEARPGAVDPWGGAAGARCGGCGCGCCCCCRCCEGGRPHGEQERIAKESVDAALLVEGERKGVEVKEGRESRVSLVLERTRRPCCGCWRNSCCRKEVMWRHRTRAIHGAESREGTTMGSSGVGARGTARFWRFVFEECESLLALGCCEWANAADSRKQVGWALLKGGATESTSDGGGTTGGTVFRSFAMIDVAVWVARRVWSSVFSWRSDSTWLVRSLTFRSRSAT